jgi:hypothetical protein
MALTRSAVDQVRDHLCSKGLFGDVTEWCESRNDCVYVVTCPDCQMEFMLNDDEYDELLLWSRTANQACGVDFPAS